MDVKRSGWWLDDPCVVQWLVQWGGASLTVEGGGGLGGGWRDEDAIELRGRGEW